MKDEDMEYIRLSENYNNNILIPVNKSPYEFIKTNSPYFVSMMKYSKSQFEEWQKTKSLKGMNGGKTNKLWADFDCKENVELALKEAGVFAERLLDLGFKETDLQLSYSGGKGAGIIVDTIQDYTIDQVKALCTQVASGLKTFDTSMYDHQRIFRVLFTRNEKTGLYKIPLDLADLQNPNLAQIKLDAAQPENYDKEAVLSSYTKAEVILSKELIDPPAPVKVEVVRKHSVDVSTRPTNWKDYKWALVQGMFEKGERHSAMMVIAATCRGLGYDEMTTTAICQTADVKHCERTGDTPISDLEDNIIPSIFSDDWNGGQYSYENNAWLKAYCGRMGFNVNPATDEKTVAIADAFSLFKDYAVNIDKNTIHTGIPELDKKLRLTIGMTFGVVAAPGVGKTSVALQMLNAMSRTGEQCVFFSYDMFHALVFQKLVQKHFNMQPEEIFDLFKSGDKEFEDEVMRMLKVEYANVEFCFHAGQTPDDMIATIKHTEEKTGKKVRFVVVDYNELVISGMSDSTAGSAFVAQKLREIANTMNLCLALLVQPNKMAGSPSDELLSYRNIKGSSALEQSMSVIVGISRPGYDPKRPEEDRFMTINCLKNRMGRLFNVDLYWDGLTGSVRTLAPEERNILEEIRRRKAEESEKDNEWS